MNTQKGENSGKTAIAFPEFSLLICCPVLEAHLLSWILWFPLVISALL